jgi:glycyl-tRNA synthetase beta subunit
LPESASLVPEALEHAAEQMLWSTVQALQEGTNPEVFLGDLFRMAPPITEFFEAVLVMDPDPVKQQNRLFLCSQVARWSTAQLDLRALVLSGS